MNKNVEFKKIWKEIFGDTDEYIELFFSRKVKEENTYIIKEDDKIAAMLFAVEEKIQSLKAAYICGVATLPQYRNKGLSRKLMQKAEADLKSRGFDLCFLIPANDGLFKFYEKQGYKTAFYLSKKEYSDLSAKCEAEYSAEFDYEKLNLFYNSISCKNKPERDYENFKAIYDCYKNVRIYDNGYLFWYKEGGCLEIIEHTLLNIEEYAADLMNETNSKSVRIISPCEENPKAFAMLKILNKKISENLFSDIRNNYVNLMLN